MQGLGVGLGWRLETVSEQTWDQVLLVPTLELQLGCWMETLLACELVLQSVLLV